MSEFGPVDNLQHALFGVHGDALALRNERLRVIASNLANADTPGFKARDIDFASALRDATDATAASSPLARTVAGHLPSLSAPLQPGEVYRVPTQPSLDGNTVDTNIENAAFARAALEYRASLGFVEDRARTLLTALTGQ